MSEISVVVDTSDFDRWIRNVQRRHPSFYNLLLREAGLLAAQKIREKAPEKTGVLKKSVTAQIRGDTVIAGPTVPYAPYVEFGTRPHEILPVRVQALRFSVDGETIFAKRVWHPGFPGHYFIRDSQDEVIKELRTLAENFYTQLYGGTS